MTAALALLDRSSKLPVSERRAWAFHGSEYNFRPKACTCGEHLYWHNGELTCERGCDPAPWDLEESEEEFLIGFDENDEPVFAPQPYDITGVEIDAFDDTP